MPDVSDRTLSVLREFSRDLLQGQFGEAAGLHHFPTPIIRPTGTEVFHTRDDLAAEIETVWSHWRLVGVTSLAPSLIGLRCFTYGAWLADIEWVFRNADGGEVALVHTSYGFREDAGRLAISAIFSHDEILQRPLAFDRCNARA